MPDPPTTADGHPIVEGMMVWRYHPRGKGIRQDIVDIEASPGVLLVGWALSTNPKNLYASRAAAEAAMEPKTTKPPGPRVAAEDDDERT